LSDIEGSPGVSIRGAILVEQNVIHATGNSGLTVMEGDPQIRGNIINEDDSRVGTCSRGFCSGAAIWGGSPVFVNNVIYGMGGEFSAAISIIHGELVVDRPIIHSNTLYASRIPGSGTSRSAGVTCESFFGLATFGELRNNIVIGSSAGTSFGYYEADMDSSRTCRPVLIENNVFNVDHVVRYWGSPESFLTSVTDVNAETWAADNLDIDPMLDADHRLMAGSGCIDAGSSVDAPSNDRDGDPRPSGSGYDIGADERP